MRTGYLVTAVMLFVSGAAYAQSIDGAADVNAAGGGATLNTRAAARLERRTERRDRREARLNALRDARARHQNRLSGSAATDTAARMMMIMPPEEAPADEQPAGDTASDSTNPGDQPADDGNPQFFLMTFTADGEASGEGGAAEGEVVTADEIEIEGWDDQGYDDDYADDSEINDDPTDEPRGPHGHGWPLIYTLGGAEGDVMFRGNSGEHSQGHHLGLFAPLDDLRGTAETHSDVHAAAQADAGISHRSATAHERAAQVLARRLAQIDAMRDRALAEGNAALLETADRLEASARLQFQGAAEDEVTAGDSQPSDTQTTESDPAGEATP